MAGEMHEGASLVERLAGPLIEVEMRRKRRDSAGRMRDQALIRRARAERRCPECWERRGDCLCGVWGVRS